MKVCNRLFDNLENGRTSVGAVVTMSDLVVSALAGDTPVHYLCYEFKGRDLFRLEEVDPATGETIA